MTYHGIGTKKRVHTYWHISCNSWQACGDVHVSRSSGEFPPTSSGLKRKTHVIHMFLCYFLLFSSLIYYSILYLFTISNSNLLGKIIFFYQQSHIVWNFLLSMDMFNLLDHYGGLSMTWKPPPPPQKKTLLILKKMHRK